MLIIINTFSSSLSACTTTASSPLTSCLSTRSAQQFATAAAKAAADATHTERALDVCCRSCRQQQKCKGPETCATAVDSSHASCLLPPPADFPFLLLLCLLILKTATDCEAVVVVVPCLGKHLSFQQQPAAVCQVHTFCYC